MIWAKLALALLGLAQAFIRWTAEQKAIDEGSRLAIAKMTKAIEKDAGIAREIEAETAGMSPEQVLRDLEQRGELRD